MSAFFRRFWAWTCEIQNFQLRYRNLVAKILEEKLPHFFSNLKPAVKVSLAVELILKSIEDGGYKCFYAQKNPAGLIPLLFTKDDVTKPEDVLNKTDVIEFFSREWMNTKWWFCKLIKITMFADFLENVPMICKDTVLPKLLLKNRTVLLYKENTRQANRENLCFSHALVLPLHWDQGLEEETSKIFNLFLSRLDGLNSIQFHRVHMNDPPIVEDLFLLIIFLYNIDILEGNNIGLLAWRILQEHKNNVKLLRYSNNVCYVSNINAGFQSFRCPNCDSFFKRTSNSERNLTTCSEGVKHVYPRNVYQLRETFFDKLDSIGFKYTSEQKNFKNLAMINFDVFVFKKGTSETQIQQPGSGNVSRYLYHFLQTLWKHQYSSATLILIISLFYCSSSKFSRPKQSENEKLFPWYRDNN